MDISKLSTKGNSTDPQWLHILTPGRKLAYSDMEAETPTKPCRIQLKSKDSREYKAEQERQVAVSQKKARQFKGKYDAPLPEIEENNRQLYAAVTVGFENLEDGGRPLSPADAVAFYKSAPDVFEQVQAFVDDRANFPSGVLIA